MQKKKATVGKFLIGVVIDVLGIFMAYAMILTVTRGQYLGTLFLGYSLYNLLGIHLTIFGSKK